MLGTAWRFRWILLALCAALPGLAARFGHAEIPPLASAALFGTAILAAAFLITWTAEAAEENIGHGFVIALVAFIAVLPEYGVDMAFTWKAGENLAAYGEYPTANMTGANRLLIGIGWPLMLAITWWRTRKSSIELNRQSAIEIVILIVATAYALTIVVRGQLALLDFVFLTGLFGIYLWSASRVKEEHAHIVAGPAKQIAAFTGAQKTFVIIALFMAAAGVILASAEPFSENLIQTGEILGIDKFILVQWLAPLASEAPEIIVATLFVIHARPSYGLATLISSNVNQWSLLVGTIPLVYAISHSITQGTVSLDAFPLSHRQSAEFLLTAAQATLAIAVLSRLTLRWQWAFVLFALFAAHLFFTATETRIMFAWIYFILAGLTILSDPKSLVFLVSQAWHASRAKPQ